MDFLALQSELCNIVEWTNTLGLHLNLNKCQSMSFTMSHSSISYSYKINGSILDLVTTKKDLGTIFTPNIDYHSHYRVYTLQGI